MIFHKHAVFALLILTSTVCVVSQPIQDTARARTLSLDVKDTDIKDVIRMISKGYGLNVILDRDIAGIVTLHLTDVPIIEGLTTLAESNGWELAKEGSVYRIRKPVDEKKSLINYSRGLLTLDIQNIMVLDFLKEISSKAAVSIVPDSKITGKVSGKLYRVPLEDGLKAILEGNGYTIKKRRNIFNVSQEDMAATPDGGSPSRRYRGPKGDKSDFFVECSDESLTIDVQNANLSDVITAISDQCDIEIITYENLSGVVNAKLNEIPLTKALALLLGGTRFTFVQKDNIILIGDRNTATPSGQTLSKSELINLKHIKADEIPKILPKNIPPTNVQVIKEQNALLVSGTSEDIVKTAEFLETVDIPTPQAVIDVIVVEYTRDLNKDFGFEFASQKGDEKTAGNYYQFPYIKINRTGDEVKYLLKQVFGKNSFVTHLSPDFFMSLRLLESQNKAKVLAQPSITVLNGNKATIDISETRYFRVEGGTENNPTLNFRPIKFGITLNITPWISKTGQVTAEINPEISNEQPGAKGEYPNVFSRSLTTTVRIEDGKTLVMGGLLQTSENVQHSKVPILGDIPIIGYLFKTTINNKRQTNLVLYITPHIIEKESYVDIERELQQFNIDEKHGVFKKRDLIRDTSASNENSPVIHIKDTIITDIPHENNSAPHNNTRQQEPPEGSTTVIPEKTNPVQRSPLIRERRPMPNRPPVMEPEIDNEPDNSFESDTAGVPQE